MAERSERPQAEARPSVETLGSADVPQAVSVLSEVFLEYPLMRFVLGSGQYYPDHLQRLLRFFVMSKLRHDDVLLGVRGADGLDAVAMASYPEEGPGPSEFSRIPDETWAALGDEARGRYESFRTAAGGVNTDTPHMHLSMFGVRGAAQGRGYEELLMSAVQELSVFTATSTGVTVRTELESSLSFYESHGFGVVGTANIASGLTTWGLYRGDR